MPDLPHIAILSSSIRIGRNSHRLALFFKKFLEDRNLASVDLLDLLEYHFPLFTERLKNQKDPIPSVLDFSKRVKASDGIIIVTPEYNGGYPASLKNAIDVLYEEWRKKPVALAAASDGVFGGTQVITSLQFSLFKIGVYTVPARFHASRVQDAYKENGEAVDKEKTEKLATGFINELLQFIQMTKKPT